MLDASVTVELLLPTRRGRGLVERLRGSQEDLHAPHLLSVEVAHAIRRLVSGGDVGQARAEMAMRSLAGLSVRRWDHEPLLARMWQLRDSLSAYDACYVSLAEALDAALLTADARLARSGGHRARIELVTP